MAKRYNISVNGTAYDVTVEEIGESAAPASAPKAEPVKAAPAAPVTAPPAAADGTKVSAPMPGNILETSVSVGDSVTSGQKLVVLEAMKMENDITAPCAGTIAQVAVAKGDSVSTGDLLVVIA